MTIVLSFLIDKIVFYSLKKVETKIYSGQGVGKLNQYLSLKDSLDVVILGSSRANHHLNPEAFSNKAYNMGQDGKQMAFYWTTLKMLPKTKSQTFIINIDTKNIFDSEYSGEDIRSLAYKFHQNQTIKDELQRYNQFNPLIHYYWSISYNSKFFSIIKNYLFPRYDSNKYIGFEPIKLNANQKSIRNKLFESSPINDCKIENPNPIPNQIALEYLKLIVDFCNTYKKSLHIVTSPMKNDPCKADNEKLKEIMHDLSVNYWDHSDFFQSNNNPNIWKDFTHLSAEGADQFSKYFANQIKLKNIPY